MDLDLPFDLPQRSVQDAFTLSMPVKKDFSSADVGAMSWPLPAKILADKDPLQQRRSQFRKDSGPLVLERIADPWLLA